MRSKLWYYIKSHTEGRGIATNLRYFIYALIDELGLIRATAQAEALFFVFPTFLYPIDFLFDKINELRCSGSFLDWRNGYRIKSRQVWHTIFDWSTGIVLDSREKVREIERSGKTRVSVKDWEIEHNKLLKRQEAEHEAKLAQGIINIKRDIAQGRSFVKEKNEKMKRIEREYGFKMNPRYK